MLRRLLPFLFMLTIGSFGCDAEEVSSNQTPMDVNGQETQAQAASDGLDEKRLPSDGKAELRRDHCCTYNDPVRLGCVQVFDNDFNSFFSCVREIETNFTISRGKCQAPPCAYIRYR